MCVPLWMSVCVCAGREEVGGLGGRQSNVIVLIHSVSNLDQLSEWNNRLARTCDNSVELDYRNWKSTESFSLKGAFVQVLKMGKSS